MRQFYPSVLLVGSTKFFTHTQPKIILDEITDVLSDYEIKFDQNESVISFVKQQEIEDADNELITKIDIEKIFPGCKQDSPEIASVLVPDEVSMQIELLRVTDICFCVEFKRVSGSSLVFYQMLQLFRGKLSQFHNAHGPLLNIK